MSTPLLHSAFYRFVPLVDPLAAAATLRALARGLNGSIVVAAEGVSGALAGAPAAVAAFEAALQRADVLGGALRGMAFRHSGCQVAPFGRLKVSVKPHLVALDLPTAADGQALPPPDDTDASHLSPAAWQALLAQDGVVLLDNRNHFESRLGRFQGALDLQVHNFRNFTAQVQARAPAWRAAGRPVAMYCTGGIRCDKTAPWMRSLGLQVWQLGGGILQYLHATQQAQATPQAQATVDGQHGGQHGGPNDEPKAWPHEGQHGWQGACFVFDKRIALNRQLQPSGATAAEVYDPAHPDEAWRLQRAQRLDSAGG